MKKYIIIIIIVILAIAGILGFFLHKNTEPTTQTGETKEEKTDSLTPGWYRNKFICEPLRKVTSSSDKTVVYEENGLMHEAHLDEFVEEGWVRQKVTPLYADEMLGLKDSILIIGYGTDQEEYCRVVNATSKSISVINSEGAVVRYTAEQLLTCDVRDSLCPYEPIGRLKDV